VAYFVLDQMPMPSVFAVVRTGVPADRMAGAMREAVRRVDPGVPLDQVRSMEDRIASSLGGRRFVLGLLSLFAGVALLLAALGLYGLIRYSVVQRSQEIGVRMALGAQVSQVVGMVLGQGFRLAAAGLAAGLLGSAALARALRSQLYEVSPVDPFAFVLTALILLAVVLAASYLPARRAARVDPVRALRAE
jgi:ABC-type antimicrobial peptide transport system permease subunit